MELEQINAFITQNWILFLALVVILVLLARTWIGPGRLAGVSPTQAVQMMNRDDTRLIDIRTDKEFEQGYILDSRHVPLGVLENRIQELADEKDKDWIIICQTGTRSGQAATILKKHGFDKLHNLSGGIAAWQNANLPLTKAKARKNGKKHG